MMAIKLNAQPEVIIKNLQNTWHAREVTSGAHGSAKEDGAGVPGLGPGPPALRQGRGPHIGVRTQRLPSGVTDVAESRDGQ